MTGLTFAPGIVRTLFQLGIFCAIPLLIVLLGIVPIRRKNAVSAMVAEVLVHGFAWGVVLLGLYIGLPRFSRVFEDFGTELPGMTRLVFAFDELVLRVASVRPASFVGFFFAIIIADGFVLFTLWERNSKPAHRTAWSVCMTAIPALVVVIGEVAIFVPLLRLLHELS